MERRTFLKYSGLTLAGVGLTGCKELDMSGFSQAMSGLGQSMPGTGGGDQFSSLMRAGGAVARAMEDLDPEQEYYLGRTVAANVLTRYPAWNNREANDYISQVGRYVSLASALPETFGGYYFQIADSDEINAFAAPGGLIIVTRGLLRCCKSEDAVAAVLAHEVGHVQHRHGIQAIRRSRITSAVAIVGTEAARHAGSPEVRQLAQLFDGAINDIITTMVDNGYSRAFERDSDRAALAILQRTGYDDRALIDMLQEMDGRLQPGAKDFAATHPSPSARMGEIEPNLLAERRAIPRSRQSRFQRAMRNV